MAASKRTAPDDPGTCINIGIVDGGSKSNVIAGGAFVHWSARLRPGESTDAFLEEIKACAAAQDDVCWEVPFKGEPLPAGGQNDRSAMEFCGAHGLRVADPVDFWTEASLFSAAGLPALVLGPESLRRQGEAEFLGERAAQPVVVIAADQGQANPVIAFVDHVDTIDGDINFQLRIGDAFGLQLVHQGGRIRSTFGTTCHTKSVHRLRRPVQRRRDPPFQFGNVAHLTVRSLITSGL